MKQVILIRADLGMGKGKMVAQGAHASLLAVLPSIWHKVHENPNPTHSLWLSDWLNSDYHKIVLKVPNEEVLQNIYSHALKKRLPCTIIKDNGLTQIPSGTYTAIAIGPAPDELIDEVTRIEGVKLL